MDAFQALFNESGFLTLSWNEIIMFAIAGVFLFLAITKEYEPLLLIPIGFGIILANLPLADMSSNGTGLIALIYSKGIKTEFMPPVIFLGVGVLTKRRE